MESRYPHNTTLNLSHKLVLQAGGRGPTMSFALDWLGSSCSRLRLWSDADDRGAFSEDALQLPSIGTSLQRNTSRLFIVY